MVLRGVGRGCLLDGKPCRRQKAGRLPVDGAYAANDPFCLPLMVACEGYKLGAGKYSVDGKAQLNMRPNVAFNKGLQRLLQ